jgi:L-rhamnose mutarotase
MKRYGMVIGLRHDRTEEYKRLHAAVWPQVLRMISDCNIRNYSIFLRQLPDGNQYLFSYFKYVGQDFASDMAKMAADPTSVCNDLAGRRTNSASVSSHNILPSPTSGWRRWSR